MNKSRHKRDGQCFLKTIGIEGKEADKGYSTNLHRTSQEAKRERRSESEHVEGGRAWKR